MERIIEKAECINKTICSICIAKNENNCISNTFNLVTSISLTIVILILNSIVFYVLTGPKFCRNSLFRFIFIGVIFNTVASLFIWAAFFHNCAIKFFDEILNISPRLYLYITFVITTLNAYNNILISFDIFIQNKFPKLIQFRNKYEITVVLVVILVSCLLNLQHFRHGVCILLDGDDKSFHQVIYFTCIEVIVPFLLRTLLTTLAFHQTVTNSRKTHESNLKDKKKLFIIMSILNFSFLFFNLQYCMIELIKTAFKVNPISESLYKVSSLLRFVYFYLEIIIFVINNTLLKEFRLPSLTGESAINLFVK